MTPAGGVRFHELMKGGFTMGESDPTAGELKGLRSGSFLAMEAFAAIPNVREFVADPEHKGDLKGSVHFPPLANRVQADQGSFKLFVRTQEPQAKAMVYVMHFESQGDVFCLQGVKHVYRSLVHSWKDTTTLHCHLHRGQDEQGPVVGAGVLHLTGVQLARQLISFRTMNSESLSEKVKALAGFGAFFARQLIDSDLG